MPDQPPAPAPAPGSDQPAPHKQPRGFFNQAQLEDIKLAEDILIPARDAKHKTGLAAEGIADDYVTGLDAAVKAARKKTTETGQAGSGKLAATLNADGAERALITLLQGIQSAAKQKHRMLAEDDDPTTNFSTDGYLIGLRLNPSRALLLQNTDTLLARAGTDALPGHGTEKITAIENALTAYRDAHGEQGGSAEDVEKDRIERDLLIKKINSRRLAIQHAADRLYPYTDATSPPSRRAFKLPSDRPFNG